MNTVKVKHIGQEEFRMNHGDVVEVFAPGAIRAVPAYVAEILLREEGLEREWKKDGHLLSEKRVALFERVEEKPVEKSVKEPAKKPARKAPVKKKTTTATKKKSEKRSRPAEKTAEPTVEKAAAPKSPVETIAEVETRGNEK